MRTWKQWSLAVFFLLLGGAFYVNAQDIIVLKDGSIIEAKVMEISPSEIKYKRFDHLDGPTIVIPAATVLSIRYENGATEIVNADAAPRQEKTQAERPENTAIDPDKFIFGINANAGGAIGYAWDGGAGAGVNVELGKGKFNMEINLMFPSGGFGMLLTFNGFAHSKNGGFYFGGGIGYVTFSGWFDEYYYYSDGYSSSSGTRSIYETVSILPIGLNIGYKIVTKSGLYFRIGAFLAYAASFSEYENISSFFFKPDLAIGWTMR